MAKLSREKVREIISNAPEGTTPGGIVAALRQQGHELEGYPTKEEKTHSKTVGSFLGGLGEVALRTLQAPQAMVTEAARGIGEAGYDISQGEFGEAREDISKAGKRISEIPEEVGRGFQEGLFSPDDLTSPSKELELDGVLGFALDVWSDPTNLLDIGLVAASRLGKVDEAVKIAEKSPVLERMAHRLYQNVIQPRVSVEKEAFARIASRFDEASTMGKRLSKYGVKGTLQEITGTMKSRIPVLSKELNNAAKKTKKTIDLTPTYQALKKMSDNISTAAVTEGERTLATRLEEVAQRLKKGNVPASEALRVKRAHDEARLLGSGNLSGAMSETQRIHRTVANSLRDQINKIPALKKLNAEISTYYDVVEEISREGAKRSADIPGINRRFPFVRTGLSGAKLKTSTAKMLMDISEVTNVPMEKLRQIVTHMRPGLLRELLEQFEE